MNDTLSASSPLGKRLLDEGFNPSGADLSKNEALRWTIEEHQFDLLRQLIADGADVNAKDKNGQGPIYLTTIIDACEEMLLLHEAGAAIDVVDRFGSAPLHTAAANGNNKVIRLLIDTFGVQLDPRDYDGWTPFVGAARNNHCETLKLLRDLGADVQVRDNSGNTPLHHACLRGCVQAAELLLELGVCIDSVNEDSCTPLYEAVRYGQTDTTHYLLEAGADLSVRSSRGRTALHVAAWEGYGPVIDILLESTRADLEAKDNQGDTPLSLAAYCGNTVTARSLVDKGAALQCQDNDGDSPLHNATKGQSLELIEFLIEKGSQLEARNSLGRTPLLSAVTQATTLTTLTTVRLLERCGADLHARQANGHTALHLAVATGDQSLVRYFIKYRLDLEEKTKYGQTALSRAAELGFTDIVALLLDSRANKETEGTELGKEQWRPLHYAAYNGHGVVVELLLGEGADGLAKNKEGRIPAFYAAQQNHLDVVELLRKKTPISQNTFQTSASQSVAEFLQYMQADTNHLMGEGVDVDDGRAVSKATERGRDVVIMELLKESTGADSQDANGMTALLWACWHEHVDMVKELLLRGANTEVADNEGLTPLSVACLCGNDTIVKLLLEQGANPNSIVMYGKTPLLFAAAGQNALVVEHLVRAHADVAYKSPSDETALSIAESNGHQEIIEFLNCHRTQESESLGPNVRIEGPTAQDQLKKSKWLAEAAKNGNIPEILRLLGNKVDINSFSLGKTALILAAKHKQLGVVDLLTSKGANVDARDEAGLTALHHAAREGDTAIMELLCRLGSKLNSLDNNKRTPLSWAVESCRVDATKLLLDLGARVDIRDSEGRVPLWYSARDGRATRIAQLLLNAGANINSADKRGYTSLSQAVEGGNLRMSRFLLKCGALMIPVSETNSSPLCLAAAYGHESIVELLIDYNANLNHMADSRQTPLIRAAQKGHGIVVRILLEMGARTDIKDDHGRTALSYAKEHVRKNIVIDICLAEYHRTSNERKRADYDELTKRHLYEYKPLPQKGLIRILELHPGKLGEVISVDLYNVDLSKNPSFEALSYEWKEIRGSVPVQCGRSRILVTPNCKAALERLRCETKTRALWIDAMCINQEDKQEVNEQVAMMTDIYRIARTVVMWLGKEDDNTGTAFRALPSLGELHSSHSRTSGGQVVAYQELRAGRCKMHEEWECLGLEMQEVRKSVGKLYHAPYFTRAWIFQEIILAGSRGEVRCGPYYYPWEAFKHALMGFGAYMNEYNPCFQSIVFFDNDFKRSGGADITSTIAAMTQFKASDPRDKVFATLRLSTSLLVSRQLKPPVADYTKTIQQVYIEAARYYTHVCHRPGWDLGNRPSKKVIADLPSWVPDYATKLRPGRLSDLEEDSYLPDLIPDRTTVSTTHSLRVSAYIMDHVVFKASITRETDIYDIVRSMVRILADDGIRLYDAYRPQSRVPQAPPKILTGTIFEVLLECLFEDLILNGDEESDDNATDNTSDEDSGQEYSADEDSGQEYSADEEWDSEYATPSGAEEIGDIEFPAFISWKLSRDPATPELSRHVPPYLRRWTKEWENLREDSNDYLKLYRRLEDNLRYETDMVYTSKGSFAITSVGEAEEGMVIAYVAGQPRLSLLRKKHDDQEVWYEYVDDVYLLYKFVTPERIKELNNKIKKIEIR